VEPLLNKVVKRISGQNKVESFIQVGHVPKTDLAKGLVNMDENGYIKVSEDMKTSEEGIFAATAAADGAK